MTASQSRYGGQAEVGRAPTKEPRKESARYGGLAVSAGAIGAGGLVAGRGKKYDEKSAASLFQVKLKNERRRANVETLRRLQSEKAVHVKNNKRFAEWNAGPKTTGARYLAPGKPALKIPKGASYSDIAPVGTELSNRVSSYQRQQAGISANNKRLLSEVKSHGEAASAAKKKAGNLRVGGRSLAALGLAGVAGSLYSNEARRGTINQKRSDAPQPISLAEARYRRMNGM
jgi:hypothetical protein